MINLLGLIIIYLLKYILHSRLFFKTHNIMKKEIYGIFSSSFITIFIYLKSDQIPKHILKLQNLIN